MNEKQLKELVKKFFLKVYGDTKFSASPDGNSWRYGYHNVSVTIVSEKYDITVDSTHVCGVLTEDPKVLEGKLKKATYTKPLGFLEPYLSSSVNPQELFETGKADSMKIEYNGKKLKVEIVLKNGKTIKQ